MSETAPPGASKARHTQLFAVAAALLALLSLARHSASRNSRPLPPSVRGGGAAAATPAAVTLRLRLPGSPSDIPPDPLTYAARRLGENADSISEAACGTWQRDYAVQHATVLSGHAPPRFVASVAVQSGLADRVVGVMSQLMYALLSGRALQFASVDGLPDWAVAFDSPHINWTAPPFPEAVLEPLRNRYKGVDGYRHFGDRNYSAAEVHTALYWPVYHFFLVRSDPAIDAFFWDTDLTTQPHGHADVPYVMFASNRGRTYRLWENWHHRDALRQWGMHASDAVRCGFHFLFRPNQATQAAMAAMATPMGRTDALKIGIQIRAGDTAFNASAEVSDLRQYQEIEKQRRAPGQPVIWYFISDSLALRRQAAARWPKKLLTDASSQPVHVDCKRFNREACGGVDAAFRAAAAELLTFSKADYHVVTQDSGFGMLGAWLSEGERRIYAVYRNASRSCGRFEYDSLDTLASSWAGI
ncbi:Proteophosphoglycan ppg4 [Micractinium conductrix]|uniref:Proteophosphoglycan ppg4 n=1 Tax=Micractinium conductrix TaxID=554055 RepID=A0A2P6V4B6_9CHLO|nr:Proteophosphoglycan ppg4 [Micractinium conductrix]|eukprot:PSC68917.1 Proteophosphoglycan ppg4 [Micractinium conductrix]